MPNPYRGGILSGGIPARQTRSYAQNVGHTESVDYLISRTLGPTETLKLLDLCCGVGQFLIQLWRQDQIQLDKRHRPWRTRIQYHGVDLSSACISGARSYAPELGFAHPPTFNSGDVLDFLRQCESSSFHMVAYVNSLHEHDKRALPELLYEMFRVVRDDGRVFIFDIAGLKYDEREIGSLPLPPQSVETLFQAFESKYFPDSPMWGTTVAIRTLSGDKQACDRTTPVSAWYYVIECGQPIEPNGTVKSRMLDLFDADKRESFRALMRRVVKDLRTKIFEEIHQLSADWQRLYEPPPNMGVSFNRDKQDFDEKAHPASAGGLMQLEQQLDIKVRDYWACNHELTNLALRWI